VSDARTEDELLDDLVHELKYLATADPDDIETTLLIHPFALADFLDFNDFLDVADGALDELDLAGEIQIASFHPRYQFAGTQPDDIENYTNRSPYPILHLLRDESIERGMAAFPDAAQIFEKNIDTLAGLGHEGWSKLDIGPRSVPGTAGSRTEED
ncbi:MAG TPA: DUF1415 domain-containing protein, partial [Burkholderiales bacterium]|nr:DUF1415 domain-containing protein [Burkholderiales bacterium]